MNYIETNKTITTTTSILKTPSENAQGHEYELLSPTQVLTGQKQKQEPVQPQKGEEVKRKKKSRGNRKAQRRCGRRRRKGLDLDRHTDLIQ
ncbi:unnamed protein product [Rotaria sp. Silwood1]|nr:unnamed protein product [Rotaria sp. Silwood1]